MSRPMVLGRIKTGEMVRTSMSPKRGMEFSKSMVAASALAFFIVLGLGVYAVLRILVTYPEYSVEALVAMFTFVGAPFASTLGFYLWKAKNENLQKYRHLMPDIIEEADKGDD